MCVSLVFVGIEREREEELLGVWVYKYAEMYVYVYLYVSNALDASKRRVVGAGWPKMIMGVLKGIFVISNGLVGGEYSKKKRVLWS